MHPAKRFFYVSLGILALAVTFQFGAQSARGQAVQTLVGADISSYGTIIGVDGAGMLWATNSQGTVHAGPIAPPRAGRIVTTDGSMSAAGAADLHMTVVYEDGDNYDYRAPDWYYVGNVFGAPPVPTTPTTWGRIKAERR